METQTQLLGAKKAEMRRWTFIAMGIVLGSWQKVKELQELKEPNPDV